ncbi:hypothetical protein ACFY1L_13530 [Streptomyces sp. NPDC001663]|uniref:hypothetical protein n=1 Tax=Streptomyces sp. NPDC001663 TaxID=3364597 RepID=UPI0036B4B11E
MADAKANPGVGADGAETDDRTKQHTVAPTAPQATESEPAGLKGASPTPPKATGAADREGAEPGPGSTSGRDATGHRTGTTTPTARLLPNDECDKLELRLRQAVSEFVDGPREAVEEADHVVEEIAGRFTEALTRRRRTLRMSWQEGERSGAQATHADTEQLRLALRDYRALAERLLHS